MKNYTLLACFLSLFLFACGGERNEGSLDQGMGEEDGVDLNPNNDMTGVEVVPMPPTYGFEDAAIDDWTYENGNFNYTASNYEFGVQTPDADQVMCANSAKGQHVHLIIDNEPYIAKYEPTFQQELLDGKHHILTFLSRSYHESIKSDAAHRAVVADVKAQTLTTDFEPITEPMLFYSRPKGTYTGAAEIENIMLDFYPVNLTLGEDGYQVKATINGKDFMIDEWKPYFIKNLPLGENTVTLTLMQGEEIVATPLNPVTRTFEVRKLPAEESK